VEILKIDGQLTNAVGASVRAQSYYMELRDIIKQFFPGIVGNMMANMVIVYIPVKEEEKTQEYQRRIDSIEQARKMVKKLKETIDAHFQVGIGSIQTIGKIGTSYSEAMNSFRYSSGSVAHANDLPVTCEYEDDYPIETEKNLFAAVEQGDINQSRLEAVKFFDWMLEKHSDSPQDIKMKALEFVLLIEKIGYLSGGMSYHFGSRHDYLSAITSLQSMDDLKNWYLEKILIVCRNILNKKEMTVNSITEKAKEYINCIFIKTCHWMTFPEK
jgi:two-component system, response regulator YesN